MKTDFEKYMELEKYLGNLGSFLVAFSGGTDSTLLLETAYKISGVNVHAVTLRAIMIPEREIEHAADYCRVRNLKHEILAVDVTSAGELMENGELRCYHCKKMLFTCLRQRAGKIGLEHVVEGSHIGDTRDYRPGIRALKELGILSPFIDLGFDRDDIYRLSHYLGICSTKKFSGSCLATRIPYGIPLSESLLLRIDKAENFLRTLDFAQVRVRAHGSIARIEVDEAEIAALTALEIREAVNAELKELGFDYVTVDLAGYRQGSMNINIAGHLIGQ